MAAAARRPSSIAHTISDWPRCMSPAAKTPGTLVIAGDPIVTTTPEHPRGAMLRAYDKTTGKEVGAVWMPAQQSGSPMTYMVDGKQYIIVAVSGGNYSGEYIAYTLPASAQRSATGQ